MINVGNLKLSSIDYILIVDKNFNVLFNARYDPRVNPAMVKADSSEYLNRNFFELYPSIERESSSVVECMTTGEIVVRKFQQYVDYKGRVFCIHNINIPIKRKGRVVGVVELVKDVTTISNIDSYKAGTSEDMAGVSDSEDDTFFEDAFDKILTVNEYMLKNIERARFLSKLPNPTLIYGETGTGKELFAQAMISLSGVPKSKVVIQNCASVPENLIESTLFGTSRGAYTGAENRTGLFDSADGGILFLDELNSMPYHVQGKLLRVIQDGTFRPVGSNSEKRVSVKIIAAMNIDPVEAMREKVLRNDLFYRFSSSMLKLLPLRERKEDIQYYTDCYIREFNEIYNKDVRGLSPELKTIFLNYGWGGNVRELRHIIESMMGIAGGNVLGVQDLPAYMYEIINDSSGGGDDIQYSGSGQSFNMQGDFADLSDMNLPSAIEYTEKRLISQALRISGGNKTRAAELLGIPRQTLKYKVDKLGLK